MSTILTQEPGENADTGRRFTLRAFGIGAIAAVAELFMNASPASAGLPSPCCDLASNTQCGSSCSPGCSSCSNYFCPGGYHQEIWYCTAGSRPIGCGECAPYSSNSCFSGPWACSIWWDDNTCP